VKRKKNVILWLDHRIQKYVITEKSGIQATEEHEEKEVLSTAYWVLRRIIVL
jgi:hypothetical protein